MNTNNLEARFREHLSTIENLKAQSTLILKAGDLLVQTLKSGGKVLICGNGGSACDSQHIAAELIGRYKKERRGLPAIALTSDSAVLTAWSNDYSYETLFSRQVEALGAKGDLLLAISTSGKSKNVLEAMKVARKNGLKIIGLTSMKAKDWENLTDVCLMSPSDQTARIQEAHIFIYHSLCEMVDEAF